MAAEIGVWLRGRNQKKIAVGKSLATFEIDLLFVQPHFPCIVRARIAVKIGKNRDVDAKPADHLQPGGLQVDGSRVRELLIEMEMEVAHQHFEAGHRLVDVPVRVGEHPFVRGCPSPA